MSPTARHTTAYWIALIACVASSLMAAHFVGAAWLLRTVGDTAPFQPLSAAQVSSIAAPFQANTRETDGLFRIVQKQHSEAGLMFSFLVTMVNIGWSLALVGAIAFVSLSLLLLVCLWLLPRPRRSNSLA